MDKLTSQRAIRATFWRENKELKRKRGVSQNGQCCDTRSAFVFWVDFAQRDGRISPRLARTVTL
jgi:hypothetical protein